MGRDDVRAQRDQRRSVSERLGTGKARALAALRSRRVVGIVAAVAVVGVTTVVVVERAQSARAATSYRQEVGALLETYRTAQQALRGAVDEAGDLVAQTSTEDGTQEAREAVSQAMAAALPLLREPPAGTATGLSEAPVLAAATRLEQLTKDLGAAHDAWQLAKAAADERAAEQDRAAAEKAAADQAAADQAAAEQAAADKAAAAADKAPKKAKSGSTTVPAPVYDGSNGRLDPAVLCAIPFLPDHQTVCRSLDDLVAFSNAFKAKFGIDLPIDPWPESCYRSYAQQVATFERFGSPQAARPGTSNHGWGKALDIIDTLNPDGSWVYGFGTEGYEWMKANGPRFGWVNPGWAQQDGINPEPLHLEYVR